MKQIADLIRELNGQPTTSDMCVAAYSTFLTNPNDLTRIGLQKAHVRVPKHIRCFLLDFDEKDAAIRLALASGGAP